MTKPRIAIPVPTSTDFDYNRRSWPVYASAIERSGGEPVEVRLDQPPAETARLIANCQGVLLPGSGADVNPQKYGQDPMEECAPADAARENVDELLLRRVAGDTERRLAGDVLAAVVQGELAGVR